MKMPFGKHKGKDLTQIEASYLGWVLINCEGADPVLKNAIRAQLGLTIPADSPKTSNSPIEDLNRKVRLLTRQLEQAQEELAELKKIAIPRSKLHDSLKTWYRELAVDWHPDRRKGSQEGMTAINLANDKIKKLLQP